MLSAETQGVITIQIYKVVIVVEHFVEAIVVATEVSTAKHLAGLTEAVSFSSQNILLFLFQLTINFDSISFVALLLWAEIRIAFSQLAT